MDRSFLLNRAYGVFGGGGVVEVMPRASVILHGGAVTPLHAAHFGSFAFFGGLEYVLCNCVA